MTKITIKTQEELIVARMDEYNQNQDKFKGII
jgi:hypothetical protein